MSSTFTTCSYHPHRVALAVCECCRRPICIHDCRIFQNKSSDIDPHHKYCKICYARILEMETDDYIYLGIIIITFGVFLLATFQTNLFLATNIIFIPLIYISFIYGYNSSQKKSIANLESAQLKKKAYLKEYPEIIPSFDFSKKDADKALGRSLRTGPYDESNEVKPSITCFECGTRFFIEDMFCKSCGYKEQDELLEDYNILIV